MTFDTSIGIKQVIRYEWMQYTLKLYLSGLKKDEIKNELEIYLSDKKGSGAFDKRAKYTMSIAISILLNTWVTPRKDLIPFRDRLLQIKYEESNEKPCHWAMLSSVYPFWFNMSYIFGSLFRLQDKVKKTQIMKRTYEIFGERNTVERCSRYVIRSFVSWGIIKDFDRAGNYYKGLDLSISNEMAYLLIETALHAIPEKSISLSDILYNPSFFLFSFPSFTGKDLLNEDLKIENFSVDQEYLSLKHA